MKPKILLPTLSGGVGKVYQPGIGSHKRLR